MARCNFLCVFSGKWRFTQTAQQYASTVFVCILRMWSISEHRYVRGDLYKTMSVHGCQIPELTKQLTDGGRGSVVSASEFKSEDPGFDSLAEQGSAAVSVPPSRLLRRLVCAWPPYVCTARTHICSHDKDPISICRKIKTVGLTAGGMVRLKILHTMG